MHDRVHVALVSQRDLFDDAFTAIARDGAATIEVGALLQHALAEPALPHDLATVRQAAATGQLRR